jgi:hypothetical protein
MRTGRPPGILGLSKKCLATGGSHQVVQALINDRPERICANCGLIDRYVREVT